MRWTRVSTQQRTKILNPKLVEDPERGNIQHCPIDIGWWGYNMTPETTDTTNTIMITFMWKLTINIDSTSLQE